MIFRYKHPKRKKIQKELFIIIENSLKQLRSETLPMFPYRILLNTNTIGLLYLKIHLKDF